MTKPTLHFRCPRCNYDVAIEEPMSFQRRKELIAELEQARRDLLGITR